MPDQVPEVFISSISQDGALRERRCDVCVGVKNRPMLIDDTLDGGKVLVERGGEGCAFVGPFGFVDK